MFLCMSIVIMALLLALFRKPIGDLLTWWLELLQSIFNGCLSCFAFIAIPALILGLARVMVYIFLGY